MLSASLWIELKIFFLSCFRDHLIAYSEWWGNIYSLKQVTAYLTESNCQQLHAITFTTQKLFLLQSSVLAAAGTDKTATDTFIYFTQIPRCCFPFRSAFCSNLQTKPVARENWEEGINKSWVVIFELLSKQVISCGTPCYLLRNDLLSILFSLAFYRHGGLLVWS